MSEDTEVRKDPLIELGEYLGSRRGDDILSWSVALGELTVEIAPSRTLAFMEFLRDDPTCRFGTLVDITAIDWPERARRFDVVWHLLSMHRNQRIRVKAAIEEDEMIPSTVSIWPAANWFERETFDMFGIIFSGHPDLRRLLTDYGFRGWPLRKDFPTTGYTEVRYDEALKRVVYEPVKLVQEYRQFDFLSPWEGAKYILPGDDKAKA